jgi:hypothetical protein
MKYAASACSVRESSSSRVLRLLQGLLLRLLQEHNADSRVTADRTAQANPSIKLLLAVDVYAQIALLKHQCTTSSMRLLCAAVPLPHASFQLLLCYKDFNYTLSCISTVGAAAKAPIKHCKTC